jgi:putative serine protease PepD
MPATLHPSPQPPRIRPPDDRQPAEATDGRGPRRRRPSRLAALLATTALLGGGASAGILAAAGVLGHGGSQATTVIQASSTSSSSGGLNPGALYTSASPGVVDITAKGTSTARSAAASPFGGPPQQSQTTATGTGFVVDGAGHIVTASHVVDGASSVTVAFAGGATRKATVVGQDDATDVAVLKVDTSGLTLHPLKLASSGSLQVGDALAAIGDPFGYARSISTGIVSGVDRTIQAPNGFTVAHAIQTDASLNPGNSGGPLLNAAGEVTGIVDQIATGGSGADQSSGVGFAVPIDLVKSQLTSLEAGKKVSHAYLGVATSASSTPSGGATVGQVTPGGPAASAGLKAGDVVTAFGGTTVKSSSDLVAAIAGHQPGDQVKVTVRRGSSSVERSVTLGTQPARSTSAG